MVGLGNKYPKQLLNSAVLKVLFSDSTVKLQMLTTITVYRMGTWHRNAISGQGIFFPKVTKDDVLSMSLGAISKTDTSNRDAALL
jgi:hypothetical protein